MPAGKHRQDCEEGIRPSQTLRVRELQGGRCGNGWRPLRAYIISLRRISLPRCPRNGSFSSIFLDILERHLAAGRVQFLF